MCVGAFADGAEEAGVAVGVFDLCEGGGELVGVDEFGVSEDLWCLAEEVFGEFGVHVELLAELVLGVDEAEGVVVGFSDELAAAGFGELLEEVDDIGGVFFELVEDGACDGVGDSEVAFVAANEVEHELGGWAIAFVGDFFTDLAVGFVVEVERVGVEDRVVLEAVGLVDLEIEDD